MNTPTAFSTTLRFATRSVCSPLFMGTLALALCACATSSKSSSSTPASAAVAAAPAPATPAPVVSTPAPVVSAPAPVVSAPAPEPVSTTPAPTVVAASIDFDKQVKPFFDEYCIRCHGGTAGRRPSGNYDFTYTAGLKRGAGNSTRSPIYTAISGTRGHMPPTREKQPGADDIAMIKQWVDQGATIADSYPTSAVNPLPTAAPAPRGDN